MLPFPCHIPLPRANSCPFHLTALSGLNFTSLLTSFYRLLSPRFAKVCFSRVRYILHETFTWKILIVLEVLIFCIVSPRFIDWYNIFLPSDPCLPLPPLFFLLFACDSGRVVYLYFLYFMAFFQMSVPPQVQKVLDDVDKRLHEPSPITNVLSTVEQKTGLKRLHIVLGKKPFLRSKNKFQEP